MSYDYKTQKEALFTPDGVKKVLQFQTAAKRLQKLAGAFRLQELMTASGTSGDSWDMLACVDYLAEVGEIKLAYDPGVTQYRVYLGRD